MSPVYTLARTGAKADAIVSRGAIERGRAERGRAEVADILSTDELRVDAHGETALRTTG